MRLNFSLVASLSKLKVSFSVPFLYFNIEPDLFQYFSQYGQVLDQIVMRDKVTMRGRGFGFVKMSFDDEDQAHQMKEKIILQNQ
jgi:RNA recognition motif-containing protein